MATLFKLMIVRILICLEISLLITSTMANGDFDYAEGFGRGSTKRLCGKNLVEALALICNGEYNTLQTEKRSGGNLDEMYEFYNEPSSILDLPGQYQRYGYLSKVMPNALSFRTRERRFVIHVGVFDECCLKTCAVQELKRYCKQPSH